MNARTVLPLLILVSSSVLSSVSLPLAHATKSANIVLDHNRTIVGFRNDTFTNAHNLSSKYGVPIVLEDDNHNFVEFQPKNITSFLPFIRSEPSVRYAEASVQGCVLGGPCGGGGGGGGTGGGTGGGGSAAPIFGVAVNPYTMTLSTSNFFSGQYTVDVCSVNGFSGQVALSASVTPVEDSGPSLSFSDSYVTLTGTTCGSGYSNAAVSFLAVQATSSTPGLTYTVTVKGTNGNGTIVNSNSAVLIVQCSLVYCPQDPSYYGNQWGPSDVNLPFAWQTSTGSRSIIVAEIDSGVMLDHPDLQANLWTNPTDLSHGWNFVANNNYPYDDTCGHGTHVAGVIAGVINNGIGIAGAANEQIMVLKAIDANCNPDLGMVAQAIRWAADHGANIISMSFGGLGQEDQAVIDAVTYAWNHSVLLVASSGNGYVTSGSTPNVDCPACLPQVIAVGSIQQDDSQAAYSLYGQKIELVAPGNHIYTTNYPGNTQQGGDTLPTVMNNCIQNPPVEYCYVSGTSFAAPLVAGIAALALDVDYTIASRTPYAHFVLTRQQLRDALDYYVTPLPCNGTSGQGVNPTSGNPTWNNHCGYGKPDAGRLIRAITGYVSLTLTATWQFFSSSGTESTAQVSVYNVNTNSYLNQGIQVGNNGVVFPILPGTEIGVAYTNCFYDGSHNVSANQITEGGELAGSSVNGNSFGYVTGAVPSSANEQYNIVLAC